MKTAWCTAEEKRHSFTSWAYTAGSLWNASCRKMIAQKPIITGVTTIVLMKPYKIALKAAVAPLSSSAAGAAAGAFVAPSSGRSSSLRCRPRSCGLPIGLRMYAADARMS